MFPEKWFFRGQNINAVDQKTLEYRWFFNKFGLEYGLFNNYYYTFDGSYSSNLENLLNQGYIEISFEDFSKFIRQELEEDFPKTIVLDKSLLENLFQKLNIR